MNFEPVQAVSSSSAEGNQTTPVFVPSKNGFILHITEFVFADLVKLRASENYNIQCLVFADVDFAKTKLVKQSRCNDLLGV